MEIWSKQFQNKKSIDNIYDCIIESYDPENDYYAARGYMYAPDDIDGNVYISSTRPLKLGEEIKVKNVEKEMNPLYESEEINKPDISVGNEVLKEKEIQNEVTNNDIIGNTKKVNTTNHNEHQESFLGYIGGIFLGASKKVGELELNNKLYEAGKNVFDLAKKSGTYIAETTMQIYVSKYLI
jgi:hypothetical protein